MNPNSPASSPVAVIGAGGFVGMRLAEMAWLEDAFDLVPIVRSPKSFARLSKYGRDCRYADAGDVGALTKALAGCSVAINLTMGNDVRIVPDTQAILQACEAAGVARLVHTSSAEVYGRAESADLHDDSPPPPHWMAYAQAKAAAEAWLRNEMTRARTTIVVLRPGLIWGPRSPWVVGPAMDLLAGRQVLFDGGRGMANLIHVDNYARMLRHLAAVPTVSSGFYNVADREELSWRQYLTALAQELRLVDPRFHDLPFDAFREGWLTRFVALKNREILRPLKRMMKDQTKWHLREAILRTYGRIRPAAVPVPGAPPSPNITKTQWWLQGTQRKLPTRRWETTFPNCALLDFSEAMERTGQWLRFAGYQA